MRYSQLTLFPQPKPTDEHRWPRGYTPERQAEVRKALGDRVSIDPKVDWESGKAPFVPAGIRDPT